MMACKRFYIRVLVVLSAVLLCCAVDALAEVYDSHGGMGKLTRSLSRHLLMAEEGQPPPLWEVNFAGSSDCSAYAVQQDLQDSSLVTGHFDAQQNFGDTRLTSRGTTDAFLAKVSSTGTTMWAMQFGGEKGDLAHALAVDHSKEAGDVIVAGLFSGLATFGAGSRFTRRRSIGQQNEKDIFVTKVSSTGTVMWVKAVGSGPQDNKLDPKLDEPSVAVHSTTGDVFMASSFTDAELYCDTDVLDSQMSSVGKKDIILVKYTRDGVMVWCKRFGGSENDIAHEVVVDSAGDVLLCGQFGATVTFGPHSGQTLTSTGSGDAFYMKVSGLDGEVVWVRHFGGAEQDRFESIALQMNQDGQEVGLVMSGRFSNSMTLETTRGPRTLTSMNSFDAFVLQVDNAGLVSWYVTGAGPSHDRASAVAVDSEGTVVVSGLFKTSLTLREYSGEEHTLETRSGTLAGWLAKITPDGSLHWAVTTTGSNSATYANGLAVSQGDQGHALVAGNVKGPSMMGRFPFNYNGDHKASFLIRLPLETPPSPPPLPYSPPSPLAPAPPPVNTDPRSFVISFTLVLEDGVKTREQRDQSGDFIEEFQAKVSEKADTSGIVVHTVVGQTQKDLVIKTDVIFPPSLASRTQFTCRASSSCGRLLDDILEGELRDRLQEDPFFRGKRVEMQGDVTTSFQGNNVVLKLSIQEDEDTGGKVEWFWFLIGLILGAATWLVCVFHFERVRPQMNITVFFLAAVSMFNFLSDIAFISHISEISEVNDLYVTAAVMLGLYTFVVQLPLLAITMYNEVMRNGEFEYWLHKHPAWGALVALLSVPNIEVTTMFNSRVFESLHVVWHNSPHQEHLLAVLGMLTLFQDIPQLACLVAACSSASSAWGPAAQASVVGTMMSLTYTCSLRVHTSIRYFFLDSEPKLTDLNSFNNQHQPGFRQNSLNTGHEMKEMIRTVNPVFAHGGAANDEMVPRTASLRATHTPERSPPPPLVDVPFSDLNQNPAPGRPDPF